MNAESVSKTGLFLARKGGEKLRCELKRHLSPRTVGLILRSLPIAGNAHRIGPISYIETPIESGAERPRREFKKGDIAFDPATGSICFFSRDADAGKIMTPIGRITDNVDPLEKLKPGDVLELYESG